MPQYTPASDEKTVVGKIDDDMATGLTHESRGITGIPWLFVFIAVFAVVLMVFFLVHNR